MNALVAGLTAFVLFAGAVSAVYGAVTFVNRRRTRVSVTGESEIIYEPSGRAYEAFVVYVRSDRDDPVAIEGCGIIGQDNLGHFWRLSLVASALPGQPTSRGLPFRWVCLLRTSRSSGLTCVDGCMRSLESLSPR